MICLLCILILSFVVGRVSKTPEKQFVYITKDKVDTNDILDRDLIDAIIYIESHGNPVANDGKGCIGLMQINWKVWKKELRKIGITKKDQLYHPETNKKAGKYILKCYYREVLKKYSGGSKEYANKVLKKYDERKMRINVK